jgi:predicted ATP-binding protein involved in virulence
LLIDEIDLHLHPKWQRKLIDFITQIQSHLFSHQYESLIKKARLKGRIK